MYKTVLFFKPFSPEIYDYIGNIYFDNRKFNQAIKYYNKALKVNKRYFEAYKNIARIYLEIFEYEKCKEFFEKAYNLERKDLPNKNLKTTIFKIKHDIEQMHYLIKNNYLDKSFLTIIDSYQNLYKQYINQKDIFINLPKNISKDFNKNYYFYQTKSCERVINKQLDYIEIQKEFINNNPGYVHFDSFLTEEVLNELYKFCLLSTIWHGDKKTGGYVGSYIDDGFNNQIIYQIAEELKKYLPEIFKDLSLIYVWAYKYDSQNNGIAAHADKALINVNFWITPDYANLNTETGGLIIYPIKPPEEWDFYQYNSSTDKIEQFLSENELNKITIPYKQNRCIIFDSSLFHKSDQFDFRPDYEYKRINITMLFGHKD